MNAPWTLQLAIFSRNIKVANGCATGMPFYKSSFKKHITTKYLESGNARKVLRKHELLSTMCKQLPAFDSHGKMKREVVSARKNPNLAAGRQLIPEAIGKRGENEKLDDSRGLNFEAYVAPSSLEPPVIPIPKGNQLHPILPPPSQPELLTAHRKKPTAGANILQSPNPSVPMTLWHERTD